MTSKMVDKDEAPAGYYAVESQLDSCATWTSPQQMRYCAFYARNSNTCTRRKIRSVDCIPSSRKDGVNVIFLVDPAATAASTAPATHTFQDSTIIDDLGLNSSVDSANAPAGMVAKLATDGCQGCFYLKGKADCVRTAAISCTSLGRKDESNVIFVPL